FPSIDQRDPTLAAYSRIGIVPSHVEEPIPEPLRQRVAVESVERGNAVFHGCAIEETLRLRSCEQVEARRRLLRVQFPQVKRSFVARGRRSFEFFHAE